MQTIARNQVTKLACAAATLAALCGARAAAQETPTAPPTAAPAPAEAPKWGFDVSVFTVNPPDDDAYASTVLRADRDWLHLEGRWNYEALHTGSLFVGRNFELFGEDDGFGLSVVPMFGAVAGDVDGLAPGLEFDATWKWFELYNETEYFVSTNDHEDDFIYAWSELTVAPLEWLKFGIVGQRTNAYDTRLSIDRGLLLSLSHGPVSGTIYWFNPDKSESYVMFTIGFSL